MHERATPTRARTPAPAPAVTPHAIADRLHSPAIPLLRRFRRTDDATGLSPARLSALSVVVFAGPRTLGEVASIEQVRPPTMTHLVRGLEQQGLVRREPDDEDKRVARISATRKGRRLLERGRQLRLRGLTERILTLDAPDVAALGAAIPIIERLSEER